MKILPALFVAIILAASFLFFGLAGAGPVLMAILALGLLIFVHEAGHFVTGRLLKFEIKEFAIGFGPKIFGFRRNEIDYSLRSIPLGGFVKFNDSDLTDGKLPEPGTFDAEKAWKRIIVVISGATMNVIIPVIIFTGIYLSFPVPTNVINKVLPGTAADVAGFQVGDRIIEIDGKTYSDWERIRTVFHLNPAKTLDIVVLRDDKELHLKPSLSYSQGFGLLGVEPKVEQATKLQAVRLGLRSTYDMAALTISSLQFLITRPNDILPQLSGPVGIVNETSKAFMIGYGTFLWIIGLISVNLAIVNMLPIPPLDGGRFVLLIVEGLSKRPVSQKAINILQTAGILIFLSLFIYITFRDIIRVFIEKESFLRP